MSGHSHEHSDNVAPFLLGALSDLEAQAFERHLMSCSACQEELEWLRPAAESLPRSVSPLEPPASIKGDLMETVRQEAGQAPVAPRRPWRERLPSQVRMRPAMALASAAALLAAGGLIADAVTQSPGNDSGRTVAAKTDSKRVPAASGSLIVPQGEGEGAVLRVHGMPALGSDKTYQVWLARGNERIPQSLFNVSGDGEGSGAVSDRLKGADAVLVTREPAGGGSRPSEEPVVRVPLDGS